MNEPRPDPITLELYRHRFSGVAEEMGVTLRRTAYSPNIKERLDFSCAVFDGEGRLLAQAAHIPAHLGAMPASVATVLETFPRWEAGDLVIVNDPFAGGNHLPDITMVSPVFVAGRPQPLPAFFVASRAHHADVGGMTPGSLPLSTEIYQEGIIIPPLKLVRSGRQNEELLALILRNVRTPDERMGDLAAQRAAHAIGERRLQELAAAHGDEPFAYAAHLIAYAERMTRAALGAWPAGSWRFADVLEIMEGDALTLAPIVVTATIVHDARGGEITFDFAGSSPVTQSSLNAVIAITQAACYYGVRCLTGEDAPMNAGFLAPIQVRAAAGSMVNAGPPAAVAGGNVETSQRMTDVVLGALAQALPASAAAASQGTMNNLTIGGLRGDPGGEEGRAVPFAYYETIGGGMGASAAGPGLSGVQVHMTNTLNTPVEALEMAFPFRIETCALRRGSGGAGRFRGGDGIVRTYHFLAPATVTMLSERRAVAPWGLAGGEPGAMGVNRLVRAGGAEELLPGKFSRRVAPGDRLTIETPGGGGYGRPGATESQP